MRVFLLISEMRELSVDLCQRIRCNKNMWAADQIMRDTVEFD